MFESSLAELYWFLLGIIFFVLEIVIPGFIIFFFGVGACVTALLVWVGVLSGATAQLLVFCISSLLALLLFRKKGRPSLRGLVSRRAEEGGLPDEIAGERATVVRDIVPGAIGGKVEFHGTLWDAESDIPVAPGTTVEIVRRKDLTLIVKAQSAAH